ncbi:MAG: serine kinase, partial [Cellulosimicrobium funkei]
GATARPRVAALLDVDTLGPGHRVDDLACLVGHLAVLPALAPTVYGGVGGLVERCLAVFGTAVDLVGLRARAAGVVLSLVPGAGSRELAEAWLAVADGLLPVPESTLMTTSSASHA